MSVPSPERLNDYCVKALLRCFRTKADQQALFSRPRLSWEDIDDLRLRWALSGVVGRLASHVHDNPREARSTVDFSETITQGEISGSVDARATLLEQDITQDASIFVVHEPNASLLTGANQLVVWTLKEAEEAVLSVIRRHGLGREYEWIHERAKLLEDALRAQTLREVLLSPLGRSRPGLSAIRSAAKARVPMYRLALEAFSALEDIEALDQDALRSVLQDSTLAPLENWQRFELATALTVAEALGEASGSPVDLRAQVAGSKPFARVGSFDVLWQYSLKQRALSQLDPSEALAKRLAESIGTSLGASRVDVSVIHRESGRELAHIECKWFESVGSAAGAIADAAIQIVRYARDTHPTSIAEAENFLRQCVIAVASRGSYSMRLDGSGPVRFADFDGLQNGALAEWAKSLIDQSQPGSTA